MLLNQLMVCHFNMKVKYSLHFDGQVIESSSEHELRRIVRNTDCYWEIYKHIIPTLRVTGGNQKLTILDMKEMLVMHKEGIPEKGITKEFKITVAWAQKIIKQMRIKELSSLPDSVLFKHDRSLIF